MPYHSLEFTPERLKDGYALFDLHQVMSRNYIGIGAGLLRMRRKREKVPNLAYLKAEIPRMADKPQGVGSVPVVAPLVALLQNYG